MMIDALPAAAVAVLAAVLVARALAFTLARVAGSAINAFLRCFEDRQDGRP